MPVVNTQRTRIKMPWPIPREWDKAVQPIQDNFERIFDAVNIPAEDDTAVYTPPTIETYTLPAINALSTRYEMWAIGTSIQMEGASPVSSGTTTGGTGAARASPPFADGPYLQITGLVLNGTATVNAPVGTIQPHDLIWDFDCSFIIRTDAGVVGSLRRHLICLSQGTPSGDAVGEAGCYFRYSTSAADAGWVAFCHDGTTQSAKVNIAGVAASTRYLMRMRKVANVCFFSINGGPEQAVITNVPILTRTGVGPKIRLTNLDGSAMFLYFSRFWCVFGA